MLWILEGYDGTGKTTLSKKIAEKDSAEYRHFDSSIAKDKNAFNVFKSIIEEAKHKNIVCDRFMYGQFVYQGEKERTLSVNELNWLEQALDNGYTTIILCKCSIPSIQWTQYTRGEEIEDWSVIEERMLKFENLMPYGHKIYTLGETDVDFLWKNS